MILLLGGTSESLAVADVLTARQLPFVVSVISDYGEELAKKHAAAVVKTTFTEENFPAFCRQHQIELILDATHPFAWVISQLAIDQARALEIPYLRFERPSALKAETVLKMVDSTTAACDYLKTVPGKVYLSTGSKTAPEYAHSLGVERLHVRVLPTTRVMTNLTAAGFIASQIDASQGPFSVALNVELFKHAGTDIVVTKESGRRGGLQEKIAACEQLAIPCVIIRRPQLDYPQVVSSLEELKAYLEENDEW